MMARSIRSHVPAVDVSDSSQRFFIYQQAGGFTILEFKIQFFGGLLTISVHGTDTTRRDFKQHSRSSSKPQCSRQFLIKKNPRTPPAIQVVCGVQYASPKTFAPCRAFAQ
jgi:hypothetical protein